MPGPERCRGTSLVDMLGPGWPHCPVHLHAADAEIKVILHIKLGIVARRFASSFARAVNTCSGGASKLRSMVKVTCSTRLRAISGTPFAARRPAERHGWPDGRTDGATWPYAL